MKIDADSAQVKVPPPLMLLSAMVAGVILQHFFPLPIASAALRWGLGLPLALAAFGVVFYCNLVFKREGTNIAPWEPSLKLMTGGIYGHSRNPIYTSITLFCAGTGLAAGNGWMLLAAVPLALALRFYVVAKEEKYLEAKFGEDYRVYKVSVRRWL